MEGGGTDPLDGPGGPGDGEQGGSGEQLALRMLMDTVMDTERIRAEQQAAVHRLIQIQVQTWSGCKHC